MIMKSLLLLVHLALVYGCGIAPDAQNATCCQCAGYSGDQHACHWCPEPVGGCRYFGSAEYRCPGFIALRSDCPTACDPIPTLSPTLPPQASVSPSPPQPGPPPSASPSPQPAPPLRPFSKKGVGYYGGNCSDFSSSGLSSPSWVYDWGHDGASFSRGGCSLPARPGGGGPLSVDGLEYVPMIWGRYALKNISEMNVTFINGARTIFSFNEPDHSGSSYLAPAEGAALWPNMVALARAFNLTLVAPCVSNFAGGEWWLQTWMEVCRNITGKPCEFDQMCLHTYFEPSQISNVFDSLKRMHDAYGVPIWLNEFSCPPYLNCSASNQLIFAKAVVPVLEQTPYVFRYAWFEARAAGFESLLVPSPNASFVQLTELGEWYNNFQPNATESTS